MFFHKTAGYSLETVYEFGDRYFWRIQYKKMNVIGFTIHFDKLGFKIGTDLRTDCFHCAEVYLFKDSFPVFGHKDQMNVKVENTVSP